MCVCVCVCVCVVVVGCVDDGDDEVVDGMFWVSDDD